MLIILFSPLTIILLLHQYQAYTVLVEGLLEVYKWRNNAYIHSAKTIAGKPCKFVCAIVYWVSRDLRTFIL